WEMDAERDNHQRRDDLAESIRLRARAMAGATTEAAPNETDKCAFNRLSKLSRPDYDRVRVAEAERLSIRVATLDAEVDSRRPKMADDAEFQGSKVTLPDFEPWPDTVNGAEVLYEVSGAFSRFVFLPDGA